MSSRERRTVAVLASIYALRIFGLFLILPVFALYAAQLKDHTPQLVGLAIGAYGLTQALLQIPFGVWSDRYGRKPIILIGLGIFALGSVVAALAHSIEGVIVGRALQGAGAIPAAVMALVADLTRDEHRTKAMAVIGSTIGTAFILSIVVSPVLAGAVGVPGIFWLTALLALAAGAVLHYAVPTPVAAAPANHAGRSFVAALRDAQLLRLNLGIFLLHAVLTALFVVVPGLIVSVSGMPVAQHWHLYLPVMIVSLLTMAPFVMRAHRAGKVRGLLLGAIATLLLSELALLEGAHHFAALAVALWLFFAAFNLLEAMLPTLVSRVAPPDIKGGALGVYSTAQFLGAFTGAAVSGQLLAHFAPTAVFIFCALLLALWLVAAFGMAEPPVLATHTVQLRHTDEPATVVSGLRGLRGVREVVVVAEEGIAYLKVDPTLFDPGSLKGFGRPA